MHLTTEKEHTETHEGDVFCVFVSQMKMDFNGVN